MSSWILIPALAKLRDEFNTLAPDRAKGADGTVGDLAHQERSSDHNPDETGAVPIHDADRVNEVHALDITTDLREPGLSMEMVVQHLLARCRLPRGDPNRETRLRYIIFNRRIWAASTEKPWSQHTYVGTGDPHTGHAHLSASYDSKNEASTASWHLEDIPVALTQADKAWIAEQIGAAIVENQKAVTALTTFTAYGTGGGKGAPAGRAVLDSGFPLTKDAPRTPTWENLQQVYTKLLELQGSLNVLTDRTAE